MSFALVPTRALFAFRIGVRKFAVPPRIDGELADWTPAHRLPDLSPLDGDRPNCEVSAGWHETGLYLAASISNKRLPPACDHERFWTGDGFRVWVDTRDNHTAHRANRFCSQFYFLPDTFTGARVPVPGSKETAAESTEGVNVAGKRRIDGWQMEMRIAAEAMNGFDPAEHPRLGFYWYLRDRERGDRWLTLGGSFPFWMDPSIWASVELLPGEPPAEVKTKSPRGKRTAK